MHTAYCFAWVDEEAKEEALLELSALVSTVTLTLILREEGSGAFAKGEELLGLLLLSGGGQRKTHRSKFPRSFADTSTSSVGLCSSFLSDNFLLVACWSRELFSPRICFPVSYSNHSVTIGFVVLGFKNEDLTNKSLVPSCLRQPSKCSTSLCLPLYFSPHVPVRLETRFDAEGFISYHRDIDGFFWIEIERGSPLVAHENCLVFSSQVSRTLFFCTLLFGNSIGRSCNFVVRLLL
jgi:hypothetical protein